ncbi:MAG: oxidative damage protection protein [Legionellales bacterium RIFCSPHIGHO2_12_FULL_35_11]|nr:MAG: oxidative damage protection protein [Legionellales bacterium RIFCSPHIGHO2_12_FULL_35_11]
MTNTIYCVKLKENAEQLSAPPFPGKLGEKIFANVSKKAWGMWLNQKTMIINEYRLSLIDPKAREFLKTEMEKYFFAE